VTRAPGGWERDGQPVTRRAGKMGKSLKNGVSPDEICSAYGADTLRLYEMAMGPLDGDRPWRADDITGMQPVPVVGGTDSHGCGSCGVSCRIGRHEPAPAPGRRGGGPALAPHPWGKSRLL
jgi:hypothetical protein